MSSSTSAPRGRCSATQQKVAQVDLRRRAVVRTVKLPFPAGGIAIGDGAVFVTEQGGAPGVARISTRTGKVTARWTVPTRGVALLGSQRDRRGGRLGVARARRRGRPRRRGHRPGAAPLPAGGHGHAAPVRRRRPLGGEQRERAGGEDRPGGRPDRRDRDAARLALGDDRRGRIRLGDGGARRRRLPPQRRRRERGGTDARRRAEPRAWPPHPARSSWPARASVRWRGSTSGRARRTTIALTGSPRARALPRRSPLDRGDAGAGASGRGVGPAGPRGGRGRRTCRSTRRPASTPSAPSSTTRPA